MKLRRKRNKVTLISSQSDEPTLDILMLAEAIRRMYPDMEVTVLSGKMKRNLHGAFAFFGSLLSQMCHIAVSSAVVIEGYCVSVSLLTHKKHTTVLQMWHALEAIKKFSYQVIDTPAGYSRAFAYAMRMHRNYDYVLCPAKATAPYFCAAFDVDESKLVYLGLPRIDHISSVMSADEATDPRAGIEAMYPILKGKDRRTVLYAPTFRDGRPTDVEGLLREMDFERFNVVVKLHPSDRSDIAFRPPYAERLIVDRAYDTIDWFSACDVVITDYSGLAVEAAIAK
ncbi:MAG: CDP-glycerol glycerophosphotransferase family protein, partial [Clostridiales Family XIII bacterium]|nr:CDP-glycerol glycerophosphotransferase family protein [Clostridiales Family XIII bacterium]